MSDLARFFAGLDAQRGNRDAANDPVDDAAMAQTAERAMPVLERWAERAGVDPEDLSEEAANRVLPVLTVLIRRSIGAGGVQPAELLAALRDVHAIGFLAGALWEQGRHLPDVELPEDLAE